MYSAGVHFIIVQPGRAQREFLRLVISTGPTLIIDLDGITLNQVHLEKGEWRLVLSGDEIQATVQEAVNLRQVVSNIVINSVNTLRAICQQKAERKYWQRMFFKHMVLLSAVFGTKERRLYFIHVDPSMTVREGQVRRGIPCRIYESLGDVWMFKIGSGGVASIRKF
jgi:hypothetical protein